MRIVMRVAFLGLLLLVSGAMFANPQQTLNDDASPSCWGGASMDQCFHAGDFWYTSTIWMRNGPATVITCGMAEGCADCVQNTSGKLICGYGVHYNASCTCYNRRVPNSGPGITYCDKSGNCTWLNQP